MTITTENSSAGGDFGMPKEAVFMLQNRLVLACNLLK